MPSSGSPANVYYPDATAPVAPLENLFLQMATSINTAFGNLGIQKPADLAALALLSPTAGQMAQVQEGGAIFWGNGSAWVQMTPATFTTVSARNTAYNKASGAYKVAFAQARVTADATPANNCLWEYSPTFGNWAPNSGRMKGSTTTARTFTPGTYWGSASVPIDASQTVDPAGLFSTTTGVYTCPFSGTLRSVAQQKQNNGAQAWSNRLLKNGTAIFYSANAPAVNFSGLDWVYEFEVAAGDTIGIQTISAFVSQSDGAAVDNNYFEYSYVAH
jgi:hypothetical protein